MSTTPDSKWTMDVDSTLPNLTPDDLAADMAQVNDAPPPPPSLTQSGHPHREYRLPKQFRDNLPEPPAPVPTNLDSNTNPVRRVILIVRDCLIIMNSFGIWRDYPERPSVDPDSHLTLEDLSNSCCYDHLPSHAMIPKSESSQAEAHPSYWPFQNPTVHGVMQWLNNGQTAKSEGETTKLIHNVILSQNVNSADLVSFDAHNENQWLDKVLSESALRSQFIKSSVDIVIPSGESHIEGKTFEVPGLLYWKLTSVIQEAFKSLLAHLYHFLPFKLFRKSPISGKDK